MLPNTNATITVNTKCRCKICYAILRTPVNGKSSQYYSVNSNPRLTLLDNQSSDLLAAFKEDSEHCRLSNDILDASPSISFTDLMERFLRVSVDTATNPVIENCSSSNPSQFASTSLNATTSPATDVNLSSKTFSHSDIICSKCSNILSKISELHLALQTLATNLREKYKKTLRIVGSHVSTCRQEQKYSSFNYPVYESESPLHLSQSNHRLSKISSFSSTACKSKLEKSSSLHLVSDIPLARSPLQESTGSTQQPSIIWSSEMPTNINCNLNDNDRCTNENKLKPSFQKSDLQMGYRLSSPYSTRSIRHSKRKGKPRHHILFCERKLSLNETCKIRSLSSHKLNQTQKCDNQDIVQCQLTFNCAQHSGNEQILFSNENGLTDNLSQIRTSQIKNKRTSNKCLEFTASNCISMYNTNERIDCSNNEYHQCLTQEEDEEKELQTRTAENQVSTDIKHVPNKDNDNSRIAIDAKPNNSISNRSVHKAKANNVDRIAASLMADCNSNDSIEFEENSPLSEDLLSSHIQQVLDSASGAMIDDGNQVKIETADKSDSQGEWYDTISSKRLCLPNVLNQHNRTSHIKNYIASPCESNEIRHNYSQQLHAAKKQAYLLGDEENEGQQCVDDGDGDNTVMSSISEHDNDMYSCNTPSTPNEVNPCAILHSKVTGSASVVKNDTTLANVNEMSKEMRGLLNHGSGNDIPPSSLYSEENNSNKVGMVDSTSLQQLDRSVVGQLNRTANSSSAEKDITNTACIPSACQVVKSDSSVYHQHLSQRDTAAPLAGVSTAAVPNTQFHSRQLGNFKRYECGYCGKIVTNIQIHVRRHTNEKPYSCEYCEKRFTNSGDLQIHTRIHTGEKPYRCPLCGKSYRTIGNFNSHVKTHDNGERPHRCILCNETFEQTRDWFSHLRSNHKLSVTTQQNVAVNSSPGNIPIS